VGRLEKLKKQNEGLGVLDNLRISRTIFISSVRHAAKTAGLPKESAEPVSSPIDDLQAIRAIGHVDQVEYRKLLIKFLRDLLKSDFIDPEAKRAIKLIQRNRRLASSLRKAALENLEHTFKKIASHLDIDWEFLRFLAETPLIPTLQKIAEAYHTQTVQTMIDACPVCGRKLSLGLYSSSYYRGDAARVKRRYLLCTLCSARVPVHEVYCPGCKRTDLEAIGYLKLYAEPFLEINYCLSCKTYVKTADEDMIGRIHDPLLLDLATLDLDAVAKEKGLKPP